MDLTAVTTYYNDHHCNFVCPLDGHKQIDKKNSHNIISNDLNEEEYCQICGDLASGWHCGYVNKN